MRGAQAVAAAVFLARRGATKDELREEIERRFAYDLSASLDEIRPGYGFELHCAKSVPEAITCFLESRSYEDRSEERRVGKECTSWCRSRWSPYH